MSGWSPDGKSVGSDVADLRARIAALEAERDALKHQCAELRAQRDGAGERVEQEREARRMAQDEVVALKRELAEAPLWRSLAEKRGEALRAARADLEEARPGSRLLGGARFVLERMQSSGCPWCACRPCTSGCRIKLWLDDYAAFTSRPAPVSAAPTGPHAPAVCSHPSWADNGFCHTCGQKVRGNRAEEFPLRTTAPAPCCPVALETHGLSHGDACPAGKEPR